MTIPLLALFQILFLDIYTIPITLRDDGQSGDSAAGGGVKRNVKQAAPKGGRLMPGLLLTTDAAQ